MRNSIIHTTLILLITLSSACSSEYDKAKRRIADNPSHTWVMTSMDSIGSYPSTPPSNQAIIDLAQNETEHFQLVIQPAKSDSVLIIDRLSQQDNDLQITLRRVVTWNGSDDVLAPLTDTIPVSGDLRLWVTYRSSSNSTPGTLHDILRFRGTSTEYLVAVTTNVFNTHIPATPSIPALFGIDPSRLGIESLPPEEAALVKKRWSDLLLQYRISPYFSEWIDKTMCVENCSSPWAWDDPRTIHYLNDSRFNRIAMPCHSLSDSELQTMMSLLRHKKLMSKSYFYVWDEPKNSAEYEQVKKAAQRIHSLAPEAQIITTFFCGPQDGARKDDLFAVWDILRGHTSLFCTGVWSLQERESRADSCRAALQQGEEWWTYVCMSDYPGLSITNNPPIRNRATLWRSYKEQSTGFLYWVVNSFDSISPLTPRAGLPQGDGILLFPGEEFGHPNQVLVSARLERWRDGAEDYELLLKLEQKSGRQASLSLLNEVHKAPTTQTNDPEQVILFKRQLLKALTH